MPYKDPEKAKAYHKAYNEANREKRKDYKKAYYEANREKRNAQRKAHRKANPENPEKKRARNKAYREANREKIKARDKAYYEANREKRNAQRKAYHKANREKKRARDRAYHKANREKRNAQRIAHRKANPENPEKKKARRKAYRKAHPEKIRIRNRRRRAREANAYVPLNKEEKKYELHLELARIALQKETGREYHIDHILPLAHGGIEHPVNWRLMDGKENSSKWAKILPEAVRLAPIQYRLYLERVGPERAREFVLQLANGLGAEVNADTLGKITRKKKLTLEDLFE
jgi:hypothetical protein